MSEAEVETSLQSSDLVILAHIFFCQNNHCYQLSVQCLAFKIGIASAVFKESKNNAFKKK